MNRLWLVLVALDVIDSQRLTVADLVLMIGVRVGSIEAREVVVDLIDSGCVQVAPERTVLITRLGQGIRRRLPELVAEVDDILMQEGA